MYAIVDVKDKQFKVRESDTLYVPYHADAEVDDTLTLDRVLLLSDGEGDVTLGTPTVEGASVVARVVDQVQGDKVLVFKKKRRKRYRVKRGHRQQYTQIEITALHTDNGAAGEPEEAETADTEPEEEAPEESAANAEEAATEEGATDAAAAEDAEAAAEETATAAEDAPADDEATTDESDEETDEKSGA